MNAKDKKSGETALAVIVLAAYIAALSVFSFLVAQGHPIMAVLMVLLVGTIRIKTGEDKNDKKI